MKVTRHRLTYCYPKNGCPKEFVDLDSENSFLSYSEIKSKFGKDIVDRVKKLKVRPGHIEYLDFYPSTKTAYLGTL